jgi:hypothetical protein
MSALWRRIRRAWPCRTLSVGAKPTIFLWALAIVFLATHLPFITPGPGSVDATNFALGVRDFDPSAHRPHPPGYPAFIALGKITRSLVPSGPTDHESVKTEARALAVWSALFGAFAVFPLFAIFRFLELDVPRALVATALTVMCPLFSFTAVRSLSDIPGLSVAFIVQAMLFTAYRRQRSEMQSAWRLLFVGAILSGFVIGMRSQTAWVTMPVLIAVAGMHAARVPERRAQSLAVIALAFTVGAALWAVPLVIASGGLNSYLASLSVQGSLDFSDGDLLVLRPSLGRLTIALVNTFGYPWANKYLAGAVLLPALIGLVVTVRHSLPVLGWLAVATGPYLVFHLLFQDPAFPRYALPLVPAIVYLAVRGAERVVSRGAPAFVGLLAAVCLAVALWPVVQYGQTGEPGYQAISAVRQQLGRVTGARPVLAAHQEVGLAVRGERFDIRHLPFPRGHEWLELVKYWRNGGSAPVWFLGESGRTDLSLIDPSARTLMGEYRMPFKNRFFMSGARPNAVSWYELVEPGWMVGEGWALTPETAGIAWRHARGPGFRPITAWIRRRSAPALMMIGGRNLGQLGEPDVRFEITLDGRPIGSWTVAPEPGFFLKTLELPAGALEGNGRYATLTIAARPADGVIRHVNAAVEQFDVQSITRPVYAFDTGWYQLEFDPKARKLWRWTGPWAALRVHNAGRDLKLRLTGDSPLKYGDRIPTVTVRSSTQILGQLSPDREFVWDVLLPAAALSSAQGEVIIESDVTFVPDDVTHNGDRRPLGLRIFDVSVTEAPVALERVSAALPGFDSKPR